MLSQGIASIRNQARFFIVFFFRSRVPTLPTGLPPQNKMNSDRPEMKLARRAAACEGALIGPWRSERLDR